MGFIRGGETITIKRRSANGVDEYGNSTFQESTITIRDALIAVGGTSEPIDPARDAVNVSLTIYLPNGTTIQDGDTFIIRGSKWVKDGSAQEWISPFPAAEAGVIVPVRKTRG